MFRLARCNPTCTPLIRRCTVAATSSTAAASSSSSLTSLMTLMMTSTHNNAAAPTITFTSARFCSSTSNAENTNNVADANAASTSTTTTTSEIEQLEQILEEVAMLLDEPLPIGTLFKALSGDSRNYISSKRLSFESFLLRYPQKFQVFKQNVSYDRSIYVCKAGNAPVNANHAQEVAGTTVGAHAIHTGGVSDGARARIYTVLKYIPNEWASYVALPIPDDVKRKIIKKPAKAFFERNPRYFEVRFNPNVGHTFEVRRSSQLQEFMKQKTQMGGGR